MKSIYKPTQLDNQQPTKNNKDTVFTENDVHISFSPIHCFNCSPTLLKTVSQSNKARTHLSTI